MCLTIMEIWHSLHAAEEVVRAGVFHSILHQVVRPFHLFHLFIDWSELVGCACLLVGVVGFVFIVCFLMLLTNLCDRVVLPMTILAQLPFYSVALAQVLGRLNPFPVRTQRRGASASLTPAMIFYSMYVSTWNIPKYMWNCIVVPGEFLLRVVVS